MAVPQEGTVGSLPLVRTSVPKAWLSCGQPILVFYSLISDLPKNRQHTVIDL